MDTSPSETVTDDILTTCVVAVMPLPNTSRFKATVLFAVVDAIDEKRQAEGLPTLTSLERMGLLMSFSDEKFLRRLSDKVKEETTKE